jgi:hypothetical protein
MSSKKIITKADIDEIIKNKSNDLNSFNFKNLSFSKYPTYTLNSPLKKYLPYTLNSKLFSKLALLILASFVFQNNSDAATAKLPKPKINILRQTEATTCIDCATRAPQSSLSEYLAQLPIVKDGFARVYDAAYFDDGNDKQAVVDLRNKKANGETLTAEENAILVAAARTGKISCELPNGKKLSSNAFLVKIDGRDAIITSAHAMINQLSGQPGCDFSKVGYFPNFSFFDKNKGKPTDFDKTFITTDGTTPLNLENVIGKTKIGPKDDFLVFFLNPKKEISKDKLPDGSTRGFLSFASSIPNNDEVYLIGTDPEFRNNTATAFQSCSSRLGMIETVLLHKCDTKKGVSSSLIGHLDNNEIKVVGLHMFGEETNLPGDTLDFDWNGASSASNILKYLKEKNLSY